MSLTPGARLGPYEIIAALGEGGMGAVYRARDTRLGRDVAIKILLGETGVAADRMARFEQEARAAASINHPNIVALFDVGTYAADAAIGAAPYLVIELLEGATLRERLEAGALPVRKALEYGQQIAMGLAAAHEKGIAHRDLKPENIFITADDRVKILDFGLAKLTEADPRASGLTTSPTTPRHTMPGTVLGTAGYMAPEQVRGLESDHRVDIFALGAVLYEMLAGQRAFPGHTAMDMMMAIAREDPPSLSSVRSDLPLSLVRVVERCLEKLPGARFQSTRDLAFAISSAGSSSSTGVLPVAVAPDAHAGTPPLARARLTWGLVGAVVGASIAALAFVLAPSRDAAPLPQPAVLTLPAEGAYFRQPGIRVGEAGAWSPSPDSRWLVGDELLPDGRIRLVAYELATGVSRALDATAGNVSALNSAWSPDSKSVVFWDGSDGFLKRLSFDTGAVARIGQYRDVRGLAWGDEGILVTNLDAGIAIYVVPPDGSGARRLAPGVTSPATLPAEHVLARRVPSDDLVIVDPKSGDIQTLVAGGSRPVYAAGHLIFTQQDKLVAQRFDLASRTLAGNPVQIGEAPVVSGGGIRAFAASDLVLTWIAADRSRPSPSHVWIDRAGRRTPVPGDSRTYSGATIDMRGDNVIATAIIGPSGEPDVWTIQLDSGTPTRVRLIERTWEAHPRWPRDGERLLFRSDEAVKVASVASAVDPTTVVQAIPGLERLDDWSRDERYALVSVATAERRYDILRVDLANGGAAEPFVATAATESFARFSPDTMFVAYVSDATGSPEVYVQPFSGGASTRVSLSGGTLPKWSADGRHVYFFAPDGWIMEAAVARSGNTITIATPVRAAPGAGIDFAPASDGQRFLVVEDFPRRSMAIVNWQSLMSQ